MLLEFLDDDGLWKPIAKIPLTATGDFDSTFFMGEGGLQFPLREERIMRLVYLPTNLTNYNNQYLAIDYSNINCVYNTSVEIETLFRLYVEGMESKLTYIPTDFSTTFDRWLPLDERKYVTTTSPAETLHVGEPYTYFDFHRTITDSYEFGFQLTDEEGKSLEDQVIWMEIGWKPKAGLNYKVIDWEDENGDYIDSEALGTCWFSDEGIETCYGPGIEDYDYSVSRMFTRPETWDYFDTKENIVKQYSAYFWDYQITDHKGRVNFNVSFNEAYVEDHHIIFDESMFSSGAITLDELQDHRLYVRVFHAPVYDIGHMAYQDTSELFCSKDNNVFDFDRISEFDNFSTKESTFYKGYYGEGLITIHPEDLMFGVPDLLVYQYGSQLNDTFSITVDIAEADPIPDIELMTLSKLENSFRDSELIPEFGVNNSYLIKGMPIICTITDYEGNSPFDGGYIEFMQYVHNGVVTFNISDYYMDQLIPGVYRVNFYNSPRLYTKNVYRFCTLEVRPQNWLKFGEPTMRLDLLNWYDSGWGGAYFGSDYAFYEDIYPRLTGYLATLHSEEGISDYVEFNVFAKARDIGDSTDWDELEWISLGGEEIYISSLVYDGLYYFELPLGQDGDMLMGKEVILNITANADYNKTGMIEAGREQNLYIMNLTLTSSTIRDDAKVFRKYQGTTGESIWIGDISSYGIERYFEYTDDVDTYGIDAEDVLLNLRGFEDIEIVEVRGIQGYDEIIVTDYTVEPDGYTITLSTTLDNYTDVIISYAINLRPEEVMQWTFSEAQGFEHNTIILNTDSSPIILNHDNDNYLGTFYSKFNESNYIGSDKTLLLDLAFSDISDNDFIIYNITDINNQEILNDLASASIDNGRIKLTFNTRNSEDINVIYGIATYKLDRGYQRIGMLMSDAVRKLSKFHNDHEIYNHSSSSYIDLLTVPDDPQNPLEAGESKILIPLLEGNKTTITFNQLALLYDTILNGSFYLDDCVLAPGINDISPVLATFTFTTEDGESYFDYVTIDPSTGENKFDFEISLQPIYATKGYTTIDIEIDFLSYGNKSNTLQYILFEHFELTCDDRILQVVAKPMETRQGTPDVAQIINTAHYTQIFTDRLTDAYGVYNNSWMTISVEGFDGYGELVQLYKEDDELLFNYTENNEHYFQCLESKDYRLTDSLGFHINAYDLELPEYIEGEINLYAGQGTYAYGEVYESDIQFGMNWDSIDSNYIVDVGVFSAGDYNSDNFPLTYLPITSQGVFIEGELYLHHKIDLTDSNNIITSELPTGVDFAVAIANSTSKISSVDISSIDRISKPWSWVESWQGFAFTEDDYSTYNGDNADSYNPSNQILTKGTHYDLVITDTGENQIHFYEDESVIISLLSSNIIQVDFHINYEFSETDYSLDEGANTYDVKLHWKFPDASYVNWSRFEYHPDLTDTATFNASFSHLSEYASVDDYKSTYTEEFQFYPNEYNFTTFEFTGFDDDYYEVSLNLTYGGDFQNRWNNVSPFGLTFQTESGERYFDYKYFLAWRHDDTYENEPIFTFKLSNIMLGYLGILNDSEVLVTYYYMKESLSYYTKYDNILSGPGYDLIIKDSEGTTIYRIGNISSIKGNNITFTENIRGLLDIGEKFTITYDYKTIGGLLDTKHFFIEVQPYEMTFYNNYYPFSGGSIVAPMYYNLSANYQYQLALNYRLQEKSILSFEFTIETTNSTVVFELENDTPELYPDDTPIVLAQFINNSGVMVSIEDKYVSYNTQTKKLTINISKYEDAGLGYDSKVYVNLYANSHNKYQYYHSLTVNLANDIITLLNWTTAQSPEDTLMANYESSHFIYGTDPYSATSQGKVQQIFAILNDTNSLIYYLTEDLNDPDSGWNSYDTLIMKMGFLNPDVLKFLTVSFYYNGQNNFIGSTQVSLDMFEDDSGTMYITLPDSEFWNLFKVSNNASIVFTPVFNDEEEFLGDFYGEGLPTTQTIEWDSDYVENGYLNVDLIRRINESFSHDQYVVVLNALYEPIYPITEVGTRTEEFEIYDNRRTYEVEYNNISIPESYIDPNGNLMYMKDGDILYLKYNASLETAIGLTIDEMVLQKAPYINNYLTSQPDVPIAEISLLGIYNDDNTYTLDDLYANRDKLVAWEIPLDLTPFESEFYNTYQQRVFNISFDDIYPDFKTTDTNNIEHCYITDILITSNDPRYQIVVDSFFIFEFDYNATLYDSEIFDIYPNNHIEAFYFGDYADIYSEIRTLDASSNLPLYAGDHSINETFYFDAFDSDGNYYYFDSHLFGVNTSLGIYDITWNPMYSGEYYDAYVEEKDDLADLFEYYQPHIDSYSYLYVSWADANAWEEWQTTEAPNVNISTLDVMFEWYDDISEEYESVYYNQTLNEFEARNIATETFWPYNKDSQTDNFTLSQDYSSALDLDIMLIKGYFFNESSIDFDPSNANLYTSEKLIEISAPNGYNLDNFEKIIVYLNFTEGAYSDYTQFRLLQNAIDNNPEAPDWTKNDSLYVDFEYNDIDYFLLMEEYMVGSEDSMFEYFAYIRNDEFVNYDPIDQIYSLIKNEQYQDFDNFTKVDDPKTVLEFYDYDEDCTHEVVIQKDDLTGDGIYDSFKYGYINPAGEITFHTLFQEVRSTEINTDKHNEVRETGTYEIAGTKAQAQRTITINTTITSRTDKIATLIQKDLDHDGYIDCEVSYEQIYYSTHSLIFTTEITHLTLEVTDEMDDTSTETYDAYVTEYRNSSYVMMDFSISYMFRDFEYGEAVSTRYYEDAFPNEITEMYNLDNYLVPIVNDQGDEDPSNDITTYIPALENLLDLSHPEDGVSAIFDRKISIGDGIEVDNILATEKVISIPGTYNEGSGIGDYTSEQQIVADVIEVIPKEGAYYDNARGQSCNTLEGYGYYYYDDNGDGIHNIIFIVDSDGNVASIGLDTDGNSYFEPFKLQLVEKHIMRGDVASQPEVMDLALMYADHDMVVYQDYKNYDGMFLEPTFRDSLYDVWKMDYYTGTSRLMELAKTISTQRFLEAISPMKIVGDIAFQVGAMLAAHIAGKLVGIGLVSAFASTSSVAGPLGTAVGFVVGMLTYWLINSINQIVQTEKMNNLMTYMSTEDEDFEVEETLSDKWWKDTYFGSTMTHTLFGTEGGVYSEVRAETDTHLFTGQILLAPPGIEKTSNYGMYINRPVLDYSQQTRSYLAYSDFDDENKRLEDFFFKENSRYVANPSGTGGFIEITETEPRDNRVKFMRNSIMYLEDQITAVTEHETKSYDTLLPYMMSVKPSLQFVSSESTVVPEFYLTYPIYVNHDKYTDQNLDEESYHIYKIYDGTTDTLQLIPEENVASRPLMSDIIRVDAYFVDTLGTERWLHYFADDDNFNVLTGQVSFEPTILDYFDGVITDAEQENQQVDDYDAYIVLDFNIEKYRDITVERDDITSEEAHRIATMQSAHQSILEYTYQFTIAESTQDRLNEICYTAFITITSTIIVMGATWGLNKAFNKYGSQHLLNKADDILAQPEVSASMQKSANYLVTSAGSMMAKAGRSASMNAFIVVKSVIEETLEELYVDPMIEAYVTNKVKDLGYDQTAQILWSGLAESGREQFLSSVTSFARAGSNTQLDIQLSLDHQSRSLNVEQRLQLVQEQIQVRQDTQTNLKKAMTFIGESISALLLCAGAISGGIGGSLGVSFGNMLTVGAASTEGIKFIKDMGDMILKKDPSTAQNGYLSDKITDSLQALVNIEKINQEVLGEAIEWAQLDQPQKQKQANYKYIASNFDVWSDMIRLQGGILGIKPVGMYLSPNPSNEIGQFFRREDVSLKAPLSTWYKLIDFLKGRMFQAEILDEETYQEMGRQLGFSGQYIKDRTAIIKKEGVQSKKVYDTLLKRLYSWYYNKLVDSWLEIKIKFLDFYRVAFPLDNKLPSYRERAPPRLKLYNDIKTVIDQEFKKISGLEKIHLMQKDISKILFNEYDYIRHNYLPSRGTRLEITTLYTMLYYVRNLRFKEFENIIKINKIRSTFDKDKLLENIQKGYPK